MKDAIKIAGGKFVVQVSYLREVDRGGAPHWDPAQVVSVADSLEEARRVAGRIRGGEVRILEVFPPVELEDGSLRFLAPMRRAVVEPVSKGRKVA